MRMSMGNVIFRVDEEQMLMCRWSDLKVKPVSRVSATLLKVCVQVRDGAVIHRVTRFGASMDRSIHVWDASSQTFGEALEKPGPYSHLLQSERSTMSMFEDLVGQVLFKTVENESYYCEMVDIEPRSMLIFEKIRPRDKALVTRVRIEGDMLFISQCSWDAVNDDGATFFNVKHWRLCESPEKC